MQILLEIFIPKNSLYVQCGYVQLLRDNNVSLVIGNGVRFMNFFLIFWETFFKLLRTFSYFLYKNGDTIWSDNETEFAIHAYSILSTILCGILGVISAVNIRKRIFIGFGVLKLLKFLFFDEIFDWWPKRNFLTKI